MNAHFAVFEPILSYVSREKKKTSLAPTNDKPDLPHFILGGGGRREQHLEYLNPSFKHKSLADQYINVKEIIFQTWVTWQCTTIFPKLIRIRTVD